MQFSISHIEPGSGSALWTLCATPYGPAVIAQCPWGIVWLSFCEDSRPDSIAKSVAEFKAFWGETNCTESAELAQELTRKIFDKSQDISVALCGSPLQVAVWRALCEIAPGTTTTYSNIAAKIGRPLAVRAVASAVGQNNISYLVPCHRVIRRDGTLGGYRWGLELKKKLLISENITTFAP